MDLPKQVKKYKSFVAREPQELTLLLDRQLSYVEKSGDLKRVESVFFVALSKNTNKIGKIFGKNEMPTSSKI